MAVNIDPRHAIWELFSFNDSLNDSLNDSVDDNDSTDRTASCFRPMDADCAGRLRHHSGGL
jgi:hypothetical protein